MLPAGGDTKSRKYNSRCVRTGCYPFEIIRALGAFLAPAPGTVALEGLSCNEGRLPGKVEPIELERRKQTLQVFSAVEMHRQFGVNNRIEGKPVRLTQAGELTRGPVGPHGIDRDINQDIGVDQDHFRRLSRRRA